MKKNVLKWYLDSNLLRRILGALILGAITGIIYEVFRRCIYPATEDDCRACRAVFNYLRFG